MQNLVSSLPPPTPAQPLRAGEPGAAPPGARGFGHALAQAMATETPGPGRPSGGRLDNSSRITVRQGDTLTGLVKAEFRQQGVAISEGQAWRMALQLARHNNISNADRIEPGQALDIQAVRDSATQLAGLSAGEQIASALPGWQGTKAVPRPASRLDTHLVSAANAPATAPLLRPESDSSAGPEPVTPSITTHAALLTASGSKATAHPVLERTLARAVDKGFVPAHQLPAVRQRVLALADRYNFAPDDFARLTLMESGGMNPRASNGRCHGIIQFCEGAQRGAASVGLQNNPRSILGMGLLQQLDLVDRYFDNIGLPTGGPRLQLDDLYLAVLTPAARSELRRDAPLDIAGPQASLLHVNRDRRAPITRNSILEGLHSLTEQVLQVSRRGGTRLYAELAAPALPRP